jgi:hypothetical protein
MSLNGPLCPNVGKGLAAAQTLLAPDLVEAVLDGRQPKTMQLQALIRAVSDFSDDQGLSFA